MLSVYSWYVIYIYILIYIYIYIYHLSLFTCFILRFKYGVSRNKEYHFGGPHSQDYTVLGSILDFPLFGGTNISEPAKQERERERESTGLSFAREKSKLLVSPLISTIIVPYIFPHITI